MFSEYINAAMRHAEYMQFDDGTIYAAIPALRGVWANEQTREATEAELRSALEDWIRFRMANRRPIPAINGVAVEATVTR
ncbi:MAG: type II toxin-antitoxin system HicB family antitoxin [Thermomicrobiales bacterium]